jgi:hypothetical protein
VTQRGEATGAEGGLAGLTPEGLDAFTLAVRTVSNQSVDLRVGNLIVWARRVRAGKSVCGTPLGSTSTAFAFAPRGTEREGDAVASAAAACWQQLGQSLGVRGRVPFGRNRWIWAAMAGRF